MRINRQVVSREAVKPRKALVGFAALREILLLMFVLYPAVGTAQAPISNVEKRQVIDSLARTLEKQYVFPEVGNRVAADLRTAPIVPRQSLRGSAATEAIP